MTKKIIYVEKRKKFDFVSALAKGVVAIVTFYLVFYSCVAASI